MEPLVRQAILGRVSDNLRAARVQQRMTQELLARRSGLHRTEIGKLENSERLPRLDTAVKLATALEVPLDHLVDGIAWEQPARSWGRERFVVSAYFPNPRSS